MSESEGITPTMSSRAWSRSRTPEQKTANKFDLDVFRLIERAEREADKKKGNRPRNPTEWREVTAALKKVRALVRPLIHPDDRNLA